MKVYRAIRLGDEIISPFLASLGKHWTTDYNKAIPYGYKGDIKSYYIYHAVVQESQIDRPATESAVKGQFSYEREIVLIKGSELTVNQIDKVTQKEVYRDGWGWHILNEVDQNLTDWKCKV